MDGAVYVDEDWSERALPVRKWQEVQAVLQRRPGPRTRRYDAAVSGDPADPRRKATRGGRARRDLRARPGAGYVSPQWARNRGCR